MLLDLEQKQLIRKGYIRNFTPTEFVVLLAIQSFTDIKQGSAYPSQETIANVSGVSVGSVRRAVKSLEEKGVITRHRKNIKSVTIYTFKDNYDNGINDSENNSNETNTTIRKKYNTAQDFYNEFRQLYFKTYEIQYTSNERSDLSQIKSKLIGKFTDEEMDAILTITFRDYNRRWANKQYPRPVIGGICTFIARESLNIWEEEKKKEDRIKEFENIDFDVYFRNQQLDG